jgi:Spy/CpxP family protein refolding chaperone
VQQAVNNPDHVRELIERRLTRRLDLDAGQREKIHTILTESQSELRALRGEFRPQFMAIVTNTEERVNAVLTEEQRARYDKVRAEARQLLEPRGNP